MCRKITTIVLVLAMALSLSIIASADQSNGSIEFETGTIVVIPPDCCDCYGEDPADGCTCPCHDFDDPDDSEEYRKFDLGGDLYFGQWKVGAFGTFYSVDQDTHAGVQVINQLTQNAYVQVAITEFVYEGTANTLDGAALTLKALDMEFGAGFGASNADQKDVTLDPEDSAATILMTTAGSRVKASWAGELEVPSGSAVYEGKAQATLTWTTTNTP